MKPVYKVQDIISLKEKELKIVDYYEGNERGFLFDINTNGFYQHLDFYADYAFEKNGEEKKKKSILIMPLCHLIFIQWGFPLKPAKKSLTITTSEMKLP